MPLLCFAVACGAYSVPSASGQTATATLSASPGTLTTGNSTTLTWSSTNASTCTATGAWQGSKSLSGSQLVTQWTNSTYGITCSGTGTPASKTVTVVSPQIAISPDAYGVQRFTIGGAPFIPLGVNYLIEGSGVYKGNDYHTFDMFDSQNFPLADIQTQLAAIASKGFTYVRLWLKGIDTDDGFSRTNAWSIYVANIVATIQAAEQNGLHVVLTGSFPGPAGTAFVPLNYQPTSLPTNVTSNNLLLLDPDMSRALGTFYSDLLTAMQAVDPNIATAIFYFDLYNELKYDVTGLPLSNTSGTFLYSGVTYEMTDYTTSDSADPYSRQAMMDQATIAFFHEVGYGVKSVMPHVLYTASTQYNSSFGHSGFDGGVINSDKYYQPRPYFSLQGGASIIDVHNYPPPDFVQHDDSSMKSDELVSTTATRSGAEISAKIAPFIAGEFDGYTASYVTGTTTYTQGLQNAISVMHGAKNDMFCPYAYSGYAIWDWNLSGSGTFMLVDPANDPGSLLMQGFAPGYNPQYCQQAVTPVLPLQ